MPSINDLVPVRQRAQLLSARLGAVAGGLSSMQSPPMRPAGPPASPLSAILDHLRRPSPAREIAAEKLKANEFMVGA